jgi:hypothetical protein
VLTGGFWHLEIISLTLLSSKVGNSINFGYKQISTSHEYRSILVFRLMVTRDMDMNKFKPLQHFTFNRKNARLKNVS